MADRTLPDECAGMSRLHRTALWFVTTAIGCVIAALIVQSALPAPNSGPSLQYLAVVFIYCILGPLFFAWAYGPGPMDPVSLVAAWTLPVVALTMFWLGFKRARSPAWILAGALLWSGFGGFSAYVAIAGSI